MSTQLYRGLALPIKDTSSVEAIQAQVGLAWQVCETPVTFTMPGTDEVRTMDTRKVLVRCDTGVPLEVVSKGFKVHQNDAVVGALKDVAEAGGVKLDAGGEMEGGTRIFLTGTVDRKFDVGQEKKVGDIVQLRYTITGGHKPGTPTTIKAQAMRLWCKNGATLVAASREIRVTHREKLTAQALKRITEFMTETQQAFTLYEAKAVRLLGTRISYEVNQAFVLELMENELLEKVVRENSVVRSDRSQKFTGAQILEEVLERSERGLLRPLQLAANTGQLGRAAQEIIRVTKTQPGADAVAGTMWNAYNAVTYHVDHQKGRAASTAVADALYGDGDKIKTSALDLAIEYTERLQAMGVRA